MPSFSSLIAIFGTIACLACSPSIDANLKSSVDAKLGSIAASSQATYPAPEAKQPMQLEVGQWSRYLVRDGEGQPSLITYKIVGKQEDAHWIESISESYYQRQVTLMLVALGDRRDPTTMQVRTVKQKLGDDAPTEFPPGMINMMQALWTPLLQGLVINWQDKSQQQATVRAGRFEECFVLESTVRILGMEERSRNWSHPQVPLSGLVRSESLDAGSSLELLEFGLNGAVSEIGI